MQNSIQFPKNNFNLYLDIGLSYNAPHSQNILKNDPSAFIIGVEPNPNNCKYIKSMNLGARFHLIEAGICDVGKNLTQSMKFYMMGPDPGTSSFLKPTNLFIEKGYYIENIIDISLISIESILDLVPWERVQGNTFEMKSDTQGFEIKVLKSLGSYIVKLKNLQIESTTWGFYENASELNDLYKILDPYMIMTKNEHENAWFTKK